MLQGINLQQLAKKIEDNCKLKKDYVVNTETDLQMTAANELVVRDRGKRLGTLPVLGTANNHIAARTDIPRKYYDRMLQQAPDLLAANVNTWFKQNPAKQMIRALDGKVRGVMSNRYQRIENEEIAEAALPVLGNMKGVQIRSCDVTEKRLYIHFTLPLVRGEVKKGDVVEAGGIISNSEIGYGSASVSGLIWRLICLNGMKTSEQFSRRHVGRAVDDMDALWADDTRRADDKTILLKVRDMVKAVVDETRFRANLAKLQGLTEGKITGDVQAAVEVLSQKIGASENEQGGILRALIEGHDLTRWGIVNAVTAQAHDASNYDRAVEFEEAGGMLVDLSVGEWKEILQAKAA